MHRIRNTFFLLFAMFYVDVAVAAIAEEVVFESRGARLVGSMFLPEGASPTAAVVLVHGSGPRERMSGLANLLASAGIAALTYDKRGVGASGGVYEGEDNASSSNLDLLAADAAAAYRLLQERDGVSGIPIGYAGISQAGWIIPIAAATTSDVDFMVLWSAPVTKVSEELLFSAEAAEDDEMANQQRAYAQRISSDDTDPRDNLADLDIPAVWLFGDIDASVPVALSIERLDELIAEGHRFEYQTFTGYGHDIGGSSDPRIRAAIKWIEERATKSE